MSITIIDRLNRLAWLIYGLFYHLVQFTRHVDTLQTSIMTQMRRWHILSMILMRKLLSLIVNDLAFDNVRLDERLRVLLFSRWSRVTTMMVSYVHSHRVPFWWTRWSIVNTMTTVDVILALKNSNPLCPEVFLPCNIAYYIFLSTYFLYIQDHRVSLGI